MCALALLKEVMVMQMHIFPSALISFPYSYDKNPLMQTELKREKVYLAHSSVHTPSWQRGHSSRSLKQLVTSQSYSSGQLVFSILYSLGSPA